MGRNPALPNHQWRRARVAAARKKLRERQLLSTAGNVFGVGEARLPAEMKDLSYSTEAHYEPMWFIY